MWWKCLGSQAQLAGFHWAILLFSLSLLSSSIQQLFLEHLKCINHCTRWRGQPYPQSNHHLETRIYGKNTLQSIQWQSLSRVWLFATPWTVVHQAPPSMGLSRQEYWSGLLFPSPGDLPNSGIEPGSPTWQADSLPSEKPWKPLSQWRSYEKQNYTEGEGGRQLRRNMILHVLIFPVREFCLFS